MKHIDKFNKAIFYLFDNEHKSSSEVGIIPTIETLPDWYKDAKKYLNVEPKSPTFKACISFFDAMSIGYTFVVPTDIIVSVENNKPKLNMDAKYNKLFQERPPMKDFPAPFGFADDHFSFTPDWSVQLPQGYSGLYLNPLNRFDLPFFMTSGIIENDKFISPGAMPFFIKKDFLGVIEKGTPIAQVIPFKRENWESEIKILDSNFASTIHTLNHHDFRSKKSGGYRDKYWIRKIFK